MAVFSSTQSVGFVEAGADLSLNQFYGVKLNASGKYILCSVLGEAIHGVLDEPAASGFAVGVVFGGFTKAKAGASITAGDKVAIRADGTFKTAASTETISGIAQSSAAAGELFTLFIKYLGVAP